ncbi:MAG TPA: hemerythrin domain-containing protein [Polyangiaceae bacterium]
MEPSRRTLLGLAGLASATVAVGGLAGCRRNDGRMGSPEKQGTSETACEKENEVLPVEDLMREHGVLRRVLLVYDECIRRLDAGADMPLDALTKSADVVSRFIEDYHEKLEEDFVFPRFQKAGKLVELTQLLARQHQAGRCITKQVQAVTPAILRDPSARRAFAERLREFVRMYRAHAAREDTVLFPALHEIVSWHEYDALGEEFERKETQLFGEGGFQKMVAQVDAIERSLGIEDLAKLTPQ